MEDRIQNGVEDNIQREIEHLAYLKEVADCQEHNLKRAWAAVKREARRVGEIMDKAGIV